MGCCEAVPGFKSWMTVRVEVSRALCDCGLYRKWKSGHTGQNRGHVAKASRASAVGVLSWALCLFVWSGPSSPDPPFRQLGLMFELCSPPSLHMKTPRTSAARLLQNCLTSLASHVGHAVVIMQHPCGQSWVICTGLCMGDHYRMVIGCTCELAGRGQDSLEFAFKQNGIIITHNS